MADAANTARGEDEAQSTGLLGRAFRAVELLVSAQAASAKREAKEDASRVLGGLVLAIGAVAFFMTALAFAQVAAVFFVQSRFGLTWPAALLAVAGGNGFIAIVLYGIARAKLAPPVLVETRAMMKRAASVIAGR